jgi:hypothetical protein
MQHTALPVMCTEGLSDVCCLFVLWNGTVLQEFLLNTFFLRFLFCKFWKPNKHCPQQMDCDVCEFDRFHAITNIIEFAVLPLKSSRV